MKEYLYKTDKRLFLKNQHGVRRLMSFSIHLTVIMLCIIMRDMCCAQVGSTKVGHAIAEIELLDRQLLQFHEDNRRYPTTLEGLEALRANPNNTPTWKGPYIKKVIPVDPWSNPYKYVYPGKYGNKPYDLSSFGKNGQDDYGFKDDITNWRQVDYSYYNSYDISERIILFLVIFSTVAIILWTFKSVFRKKR